MNDHDEELGYDADHDDPRQYCRHGTFIGSWWGPDYLCWACEEGLTDAEWQDYCTVRHLDGILSGELSWAHAFWQIGRRTYEQDCAMTWAQALRYVDWILTALDDVESTYRRFVDSLAEAPAHLHSPRYAAIATD